MASSFWLPPLNSHENYKTMILASQSEDPMINEESPEKYFLIQVFVDVNFHSNSNEGSLKGLSVHDEFLVPCCSLNCLPPEQVKKVVSYMLGRMNIPFQLDHILFAHWHLKRTARTSKCSFKLSREDADSWVVKLQKFLRVMIHESHNANCNVLPFKLTITKDVWITDDEFRAWRSWYQEKERVDPSFSRAYIAAVSRPRTVQELLDADSLKFKEADKPAFAALQDASLDDGSTSPAQCLVCLEEFSTGSGACRLPCSHVFHKGCITKWLKESNMCPLCRFRLPPD